MCLACRRRVERRLLVRFTAQDGALVPDWRKRLGGRGVYCCRNDRCLRRFIKNKKGLARALRQNVAAGVPADEILQGVLKN